MIDNRLALACGTEYVIEECALIAHQPTIKEIALIGEHAFFTGVQTLTLSKNMVTFSGESDLEIISNFQIFMMIMTEKETEDKKQNALDVLNLLFPRYAISILPRSIMFNTEGNNIMIDENNFDYLQEAIKDIFCVNLGPMDQRSFNPADSKAKEIADKLMRGRARVAAQRSSEEQGSVFGQYISILAFGVPMSHKECVELTVFNLYDLIERYQLKSEWDIYIKSCLAGAKPDNTPDNWMKNIH